MVEKQVDFLIGNQRSGTTWLGSILHHSGQISYIYEPFEKNLGIFDNFPEEPILLNEFSISLEQIFKSGLKKAFEIKKKFTIIKPIYKQYFYAYLLENMPRLSLRIISDDRNYIKKVKVINQWHGKNFKTNLINEEPNNHFLIKETRLHLKLNAIKNALPNSRYVLLLRHPYPTIMSTLKWFQRGKLQELKNKLDCILDIYKTQHGLENYHELINHNINADIDDKLLVHWIIFNEELLRFYKMNPDNSFLVTYETLCKNVQETSQKVCDFIGLNYKKMANYVRETSTIYEGNGIVDVKRISNIYYKSWRNNINEDCYRKILKFRSKFESINMLEEEYEKPDAGEDKYWD